MAVGINAVWECRQTATAANVNGCGFNPENASMMTDLATTGSSGTSATPTVSSATYTFVSNDIGSYVFVKAGTGWTPGWYAITAVSLGVATLDAAIGHVVLYLNPGGARTFQINTVAGVGTTGALTAGTFSVDYSQQDTAEFAAADLASTIGTTNPSTITSSSKPFARNMVGNFIHVTAGTSWLTGIYEIVSVSGTTATLDRAVGSVASLSSGTFNTGGAASLASAAGFTDDSFFESGASTAGTGSHVFFIRFGTYATVATISIGAAGTAQNPLVIRGYNTYRTDTPTGSNRPTLNGGTNGITLGTHWWMRDLYYITGSSTGLTIGAGGVIINVKVLNNSTTADRPAFNPAASTLIGCEGISYRGRAFGVAAGTVLFGCIARASDICYYAAGGSVTGAVLSHCIAEGPVTAAMKVNATISTGHMDILNSTFYGTENPSVSSASGLVLSTGSGALRYISNIFYGFVLAISVSGGENVPGVYLNYNTFYNNTGTGTGTNVLTGPNDIAANPSFANMGLVNGTTGAFVAGNGKLVDTTKNFTSLGVVAGDCVYIVFGSGSTIGYYGISSISTTTNPNDTLNLDINPGTNTTADKQYWIVTGHNFLPTGSI